MYERPLDWAGIGLGLSVFILMGVTIEWLWRKDGRQSRWLGSLARGPVVFAWLQLTLVIHISIGGWAGLAVFWMVGRVPFVSPALITLAYGLISLALAFLIGLAAVQNRARRRGV